MKALQDFSDIVSILIIPFKQMGEDYVNHIHPQWHGYLEINMSN